MPDKVCHRGWRCYSREREREEEKSSADEAPSARKPLVNMPCPGRPRVRQDRCLIEDGKGRRQPRVCATRLTLTRLRFIQRFEATAIL
jgi:hypothetical protein